MMYSKCTIIMKFDEKLILHTIGTYDDGKPDATFSFTDDDFVKVATGKMNPQIAFMRCPVAPSQTYLSLLFIYINLSTLVCVIAGVQ